MARVPFPYEPVPFTADRNEKIKKDFPAFVNGLARIGPEGWVLQPHSMLHLEQFYNMEIRPTDIFMMSLPKTGSNWVQEIVWLIVNNLDYDKHKTLNNMERAPYLEFDCLAPKEMYVKIVQDLVKAGRRDKAKKFNDLRQKIYTALANTDRRLLKTHLPFSFLPPDLLDVAKVIYLARNPLDMCVSYYHHHKLFKTYDYQGDIASFFDYFRRGELQNLPYWPHVLGAWQRRDHPNILFLQFEDLKKDLRAGIKKIAQFLDKPITEEQIDELKSYCSIENSKNNPAMNFQFGKDTGLLYDDKGDFLRKGKAGDWKNHLSPEMASWMKQWMEDNLRGTGLHMTISVD